MSPRAWIVVAPDGFEAVFLDHARAIQYAAACHGTIVELFVRSPDATS